jgi:regulator of sirC expression with transglutaminase-like and TPR domain
VHGVTDPAGRFLELVQQDDPPLDEGALLIAAHAYPDLDVSAGLAALDDLAAGCPPDLDGLRRYLFEDVGFRGNEDDYGDPRNSYLNDVLDRRTGIPITLSVVVMEVGRRVGVPFAGIGLPGHFLVRHGAVPPLLLDPFNRGRSLTLEDCAALMQKIYGDAVRFEPSLLAAVDHRMILIRMLDNLRAVFQAKGDAAASAWVLRLRAGIPGTKPRELGELATAQAALGRYDEAATTLERLAEQLPEQEAAKAKGHADLLRARLN